MAARLKSTPGAYGWVNRNPILELSCNPIVTSLSMAVASLIVAFTIGDRASSAELVDRRPVRARPAHPVYDWTGPYIGINAGYGVDTSQTDALFNDAGIGIDLGGLGWLAPLGARGIAVITVAAATARIGEARWTFAGRI